MTKNITELEIPLLPEDFNLTDGHVYRQWSPEEAQIISGSADLLRSVSRQQQFLIEAEYIQTFSNLFDLSLDPAASRFLMCTTASMAIEIVANYFRLTRRSLALIEPCFDNLADIFKRHGVPLTPFNDDQIEGSNLQPPSIMKDVDGILVVTPNNPTGATLTKHNFASLVEYCSKTKKMLVLDCCFRAYVPDTLAYDQYALLAESGIDYVVIEDTGKTWPTLELKAPFLVASPSIFPDLYKIYTDMLLHVSPFTVKLMTKFLELSIRQRLQYTRHVVRINRRHLYDAVVGHGLIPTERQFSSVSWLRADSVSGIEFREKFAEHGVHVLAGELFYWSGGKSGRDFIRIALTRDPAVFKQAAYVMHNVCAKLREGQ